MPFEINSIALSTDDYIEVFEPEDLKARPIISGPESPTQRLSCFIENLLKPAVSCLTTYVIDDWDSLNFDSVHYSCGIESLILLFVLNTFIYF